MINRCLRGFFALAYAFAGAIGIYAGAYQPEALLYLPYIPSEVGVSLLRRLIWCFGWSAVGFAIIAFNVALSENGKKNPLRAYLGFYPPFLLVNSLLVYGLLNLVSIPGHVFFYPVSAWLCLNLAFWIDEVNFKKMVDMILKKAG